MGNTTCNFCSATFYSASGKKMYCSDKCTWGGRPKVPCSVCEAPTGWSISSKKKNPTCNSCRSSSHDYRGYKRGCRCEICRAANAEAAREYARKVKERDGKSPTQKARPAKNLSCDWCGARITSRTGASDGLILCSTHRDEKSSEDRRKNGRKLSRRRAFQRKIDRAASGYSSRGVWVQGACLVCSEQFMSQGAASRYCSRDCRRVARSGSRWISFEDRRGIYDRDSWVCQICYEPVSSEYHRHDLWSPTLDHIVPRSLGGSDDSDNLRLSHLWCNSVRGDLSHYTDEDLREAV